MSLFRVIAPLAAVLALACQDTARAATAARPNVIIILADDLGYGGLGVQGDREARTPHIDALAARGVRLTSGYANHPVCSPSRAGLLTGRYQHRFGFKFNSGSPRNASPNFGIPVSEPIVAERLKAAGYATGMFGKWHVGFRPELQPPARGFDSFYGFLAGARSYLPGARQPNNNPVLRGTEQVPAPDHMTEALADEAVAFIDANKARPFFVYLPFNAVHLPQQATQAYLDRFAGVADENRRTHLAMLAALDDAVGDVAEAVRRNGLEDNTLIVFSSDNGGPTPQTTSSNGPLRGYKGQVLEGGIRVPYIFAWKGQLPAGKVYDRPVMGFDLTATALALAGIPGPTDKPLDGVDLMPYLKGAKSGDPHKALFWRSGQQAAMREGDWKLVMTGGVTALYDLAGDIGESRDLAATEPARTARLKATYDAWSASMMAPQWRRNELAEE